MEENRTHLATVAGNSFRIGFITIASNHYITKLAHTDTTYTLRTEFWIFASTCFRLLQLGPRAGIGGRQSLTRVLSFFRVYFFVQIGCDHFTLFFFPRKGEWGFAGVTEFSTESAPGGKAC